VSRNEARRGRLLADDVDNILPVPATGLTQEGLLTIIVVCRVITELPLAAAVGEGRVSRSVVPTGKRPGTGFDVVFGVVERWLFGILRSVKLLYYQLLTQHVDVPTS